MSTNNNLSLLQSAPIGTIIARIAPRKTEDRSVLRADTASMSSYRPFVLNMGTVYDLLDHCGCAGLRDVELQKCISGLCYVICYDAGSRLAMGEGATMGSQDCRNVDSAYDLTEHIGEGVRLYLANPRGCNSIVRDWNGRGGESEGSRRVNGF